MKTTIKKGIVQSLLVLAIAMPAATPAADSVACNDCSAATDEELGAYRGGYLAGNGMEIVIGIKDSIFVDGVLQVVHTINLGQLAGGLNQSLADQNLGKMGAVYQFGSGNSISPTMLNSLQSGPYTIVQNSLDHAVIRNLTEISASITVLDLYRDMNLRAQMNQQLINAMR